MTSHDGVLVIDGETTKKLPAPPQSQLAVTPLGPVFAERQVISTLEGEAFKTDEDASRLLAGTDVRRMIASPDGQLFIVGMTKFLRRDTVGAWHEHTLPDLGWTIAVGLASPKGKVPLVTYDAVALIGPGGEVLRQTLELPGDRVDITAIALDGSDRLWISATFGLFIFGSDGKLLQQWQSGALPTSAKEILIHGDGPALPATPPPAIKGTVRGTPIVDGKPVANATVELIANPMISGFDRAKVRLSSQTNDAGEFTFEGVPRQEYVLWYKDGEQNRYQHSLSACCSDLKPDESRDLGRVELFR